MNNQEPTKEQMICPKATICGNYGALCYHRNQNHLKIETCSVENVEPCPPCVTVIQEAIK